MNELYRIVIIILIIAIQDILSKRQSPYYGAILPALLPIVAMYVWFADIYNENLLKFILITLIGELFLLGIWSNGRKFVKAQTKKELAKMKSQDSIR
ncbi:hypothetical protein [Metabacillus malikii]|uniref:Uncharacterized protein n=1 Tax=Metabacillus malikii TaxID=1504265 RepID=A0ABT9ZEY2_9BACI|nr:hypothetical protein [Metabacillus malikii]MDQ0230391.1 hypothetical protein [Metabacillus malikii]